MDLFEKIDQFEKMANDLADQLEEGMAEDNVLDHGAAGDGFTDDTIAIEAALVAQEIKNIKKSSNSKIQRRAHAKVRYQKLASLLKR